MHCLPYHNASFAWQKFLARVEKPATGLHFYVECVLTLASTDMLQTGTAVAPSVWTWCGIRVDFICGQVPGQVRSPEKEDKLVKSRCIEACGDDVLLPSPRIGDDSPALLSSRSSQPNETQDELVQGSGQGGLVSMHNAIQGQRECQAQQSRSFFGSLEAAVPVPIGQEKPYGSLQRAQEITGVTLSNPIHAGKEPPGPLHAGRDNSEEVPQRPAPDPTSGQGEPRPGSPPRTQKTAVVAPPSPVQEHGECSAQLADNPSRAQPLQQGQKNMKCDLWNPLVAFLHAERGVQAAESATSPEQATTAARAVEGTELHGIRCIEVTLERQVELVGHGPQTCSGARPAEAQAGLSCETSVTSVDQAPPAPNLTVAVCGPHPRVGPAEPHLPVLNQATSRTSPASTEPLPATRLEPAPQATCGTTDTVTEDADCTPAAAGAAGPAAAAACSGNALGQATDRAPTGSVADPNLAEASDQEPRVVDAPARVVMPSHASTGPSEPQDRQEETAHVSGRQSACGKNTEESPPGTPSAGVGPGSGGTGPEKGNEVLLAQTSGAAPLPVAPPVGLPTLEASPVAAAAAECHGSGAASGDALLHAKAAAEPSVERLNGADPALGQALLGLSNPGTSGVADGGPNLAGSHVPGCSSADPRLIGMKAAFPVEVGVAGIQLAAGQNACLAASTRVCSEQPAHKLMAPANSGAEEPQRGPPLDPTSCT